MGRYPKTDPIESAMEHTYRCAICKHVDNLGYYNSDCSLLPMMRERKLCYRCAFWTNELESHPDNREVIGGRLYFIQPYKENVDEYDGGPVQGADCYIYKLDRTFYRATNSCLLGTVPPKFKEHFPDTAFFCTLMTFFRLIRNNFVCHCKGCWDRYHCLRYDMEAEANGPYNFIPDNYHVGIEQCPSFINKNTLSV